MRSFLDATLRGVGQVFLQNHPLTGAIFLLAILANSVLSASTLADQGVSAAWLFAGAVLGTVVSTSVAILLRLDPQAIRQGLYGYNGTLVGIALPFFFQAGPAMLPAIAAATALSTGVMELASRLFGRWRLPVLTAPFVLTTWLALVVFSHVGALQPSSFMPGTPHVLPPIPLTPLGVAEGLLKGEGQVMFQAHWVAGLLIAIGLLVNSRRSFVFALVGSLLGELFALIEGVDAASVMTGLYGFNPVLTGIALGAIFPARHAAWVALLGMGATFVVAELLGLAFAPVALPALTAPFVLTTWLFLLPRIHGAPPQDPPVSGA